MDNLRDQLYSTGQETQSALSVILERENGCNHCGTFFLLVPDAFENIDETRSLRQFRPFYWRAVPSLRRSLLRTRVRVTNVSLYIFRCIMAVSDMHIQIRIHGEIHSPSRVRRHRGRLAVDAGEILLVKNRDGATRPSLS